jgi:hypothetical protein
MWFFYFLPILIVIPFLIANRGRGQAKVGPRAIIFGLALVVAVGAAGFAAIELVRSKARSALE